MALYSVVTNLETTLAQGMTSSQTSMVLASATIQGHTLTPADYGSILYITINPGASNMEVVRASTNSGVTFTLDKRGLAWYGDGDTELSSYKFPHNAGEPVIISNAKNVFDQLVDKFSDESISGVKTFASHPKIATYAAPTANEEYAPKKYADDLAIAGAPDATESVKGLVEAATTAEMASGTDSGSTTAPLVVRPSKLVEVIQTGKYLYAVEDGTGSDDTYTASMTPNLTAYTAGMVIAIKFTVANTAAATLNIDSVGAATIKKYASGALADLETGDIVADQQCTFIYDGTYFVMLNPGATMPTTALLSEMAAFFAATDITGAEAEELTDGSATIKHYHKSVILSGTRARDAASGTQTFAHGLGSTPKYIEISVTCLGQATGSDQYTISSMGASDGTVHRAVWNGRTASGTASNCSSGLDTSNCVRIAYYVTPGSNTFGSQTAVASFDGTNVTLTWTRNDTTAPDSNTMNIMIIAHT